MKRESMTERRLFTLEELAEAWAVSTKHIERMIKMGLIKRARLGLGDRRSLIRIPLSEVERFEEEVTVAETPPATQARDFGTLCLKLFDFV